LSTSATSLEAWHRIDTSTRPRSCDVARFETLWSLVWHHVV